MDWRYPVMVNVDEDKMYIGPQDSFHWQLFEHMGVQDPDAHGSPWAQEHEGWFAGMVGWDE